MDAIDRIELKGKITAAIEGADLGAEDAIGLLAHLSEGYRERIRTESEMNEDDVDDDEDFEDDDDFDEEDDDLDYEDEDGEFDDEDEEDELDEHVNVAADGPEVEHSKGPWSVAEHGHYPGINAREANGLGCLPVVVFGFDGQEDEAGVRGETREQGKANARRIVACVNAFNGVPIESIENIESGSLAIIGRGVISWEDKSGDRCSLQEARDVEFKKPGWEAERVGYLAGREDTYADVEAHEETAEAVAYPPDTRHKDAWGWLEERGFHLVRTLRGGDPDFPQYRLKGGHGGWTPRHTSDTPFGCVRQAMAQELGNRLEKIGRTARHASVAGMIASILGPTFGGFLTPPLVGDQVRQLVKP